MGKSRWVIPVVLAVEVAVLAGIYLYHSYRIAGGFGLALDDSWIHAVLARNMAQGHGAVYNIGQPMSSTTMLYSVVLAGAYLIVPNAIIGAIAVGLLLHFGAALLVYATARRLSLSPLLSCLAAVFFAAIARLVWGALSGMEVPLYVFLVCLGVYWQVRYSWQDGWKVHLAGLAFAVSVLARPECGAFFVCSGIERLYSGLRWMRAKGGLRRLALLVPIQLLIFAVVVVPFTMFHMRASGKPLPPAFYAKTKAMQSKPHQHDSTLAKVRARAGAIVLYDKQAMRACLQDNEILFAAMLVGIVGCALLARRQETSGALILPLGLFLVPAATAVAARTSLTQLLSQDGRMSAYLAPLMVLMAMLGISAICTLLEMKKPNRRWMGGVVLAAFVVATAITLIGSNARKATIYGTEVSNINEMQVAIGKWAAGLPEDTVLAVNDAGAIPYFSRRKIIDTIGVVNPEIASYLGRYPNPQIGLLQYLRERKPDYVIIFPNWYPTLSARRDVLTPIKSVRLKHNVVCGGPEMVVYRPVWKK